MATYIMCMFLKGIFHLFILSILFIFYLNPPLVKSSIFVNIEEHTQLYPNLRDGEIHFLISGQHIVQHNLFVLFIY